SQKHDKQGLGYSSSENDFEKLSSSCPSDRLQPSGGYNTVPPPITGNFMPPKPDLVFHTAPIAVETAHSAFTVKLSSYEPTQDLSHTNRPSAPIIEEWVSDSEDYYETTSPHIAYSFVQSTEQVTPLRHSVQPIKTPILASTPKPTSPKTSSSGKRKNRKTCFVCKSVDHLIKDCNFHVKPQTQPTSRNYAHKGFNKQHASFSNKYPLKHIVPAAVLPKSKPVSVTVVRPALVVSAAKELNGGYVAFGGNSKGGKITGKGKIKIGTVPTWLFDIDSLTRTMNYQPVTAGNQSNLSADFQEEFDAGKTGEEVIQQYMLFPVWSTGSTNLQNKEGDATFNGNEHSSEHPELTINLSPSSNALSGEQDDITKKGDKGKSHVDYFKGNRDFNEDFEDYSEDSSNDVSAAGPIVPTTRQNYFNSTNPISIDGPSNSNTSPIHGNSSFEDASQSHDMPKNKDIVYSYHENVGAKADFNNLETSITVSHIPTTRIHNAHPVSQIIDPSWIEAMQEELLQFKMQKVWILVDLPHGKKAIGFMVYQMNVKSAFSYRTIEEEVYVCQPPGFKDPNHPDKVYKVVKALYGLHQAPRAWYETLATYLLENGFHRGQIDQTLFIKKQKGDILLVKQKEDGIFINQDKYVAEILKKFGLTKGKSASTPIHTEKPLLKDPDDIMFAVCACARFQVTPKVSHLHAVKKIFRYLKGKLNLGLWYPKDSPFDLVAYSDSDYAGASLDRKSTTGGCQFLRSRLISLQCKKQTVVATSSTEAEYVVGASCCAQVLWIQNQMLDYG
nr:hypothetical protein [Tanacetum cinerariifolium]